MAEEEPVSVTVQPPTDLPQKRKLDDLESDAPAEESNLEADGERNDEEKHEDENGDGEGDGEDGDEGSEPAKRPRLDEAPDASENGHKLEDTTEQAVENAETAADDHADNNEVANEAPSEGGNAAQPVSESEQKADGEEDNSEGKDVQGDNAEAKAEEVPSSDKEQLENVEKPSEDEPRTPAAEGTDVASGQHHSESGNRSTSRRIEIPNNKVGVLIGKSGDTIKYLQINSGAKIQITRDADADPRAPTRPVELVGTLESLNKAERLIKDVIAEADAGGSPSLIARGFSASMNSGSAEIEMPVPSDKVGLIIGKGGETIRSLQTRSGARIQLIPQNTPGDQSKEKKVKVTGDKKQVEMAIELIKEVMNQMPGRQSHFSGNNYNQQGFRPRGPGGPQQWGARGGPPGQPMAYDGHQRGQYPSQGHHYPHQGYGNYPPQGPPRSNYGPAWDNRPPPTQGPPHHGGGGYDYYGQGGGHGANAPVSAPQPPHMGGGGGPPPHSQANYNYGQARGADYPPHQPTPYSQTAAPPAQGYGHGYGEPKYDNQGQAQPSYGGGGQAQQQQGYPPPHQQYNRPPPQPYGAPSQAAPTPQGYAPPTANQPTDPSAYQAPVSAPQAYGQTVPPQQQYPQQAAYGSAPDAYAQQQPVAGYQQPGAAPVAAQYGQQPYAQAAAPAAGYGQYPTAAAQPGYGDQSSAAGQAAAAPAYGYAGQVDPTQAAYAASQGYSAAPAVAQQGYAQAQPVAAQPGYDQSAAAAQTGGYAAAAVAAAPASYGKNVSPQPQPGYPPQYDASQAQQMYAAPR